MSVHNAITNHVNKQNKLINDFLALEQEREFHIDQELENVKQGKPLSVDKINEVTGKMNELSRQGIVPPRKYVTTEMIEEYANKKYIPI